MSLLAASRACAKSFGGVVAAQGVTLRRRRRRAAGADRPERRRQDRPASTWSAASSRPTAARVLLAAPTSPAWRRARIWRQGVGRTFQIAQTFVSMTVAENVQMALISRQRPHARAAGPGAADCTATRRSRCSTASAWPAEADRPVSELAYGDVKRVELAIALAGAPKLLLMDEPTAGMAPERARAADGAGGRLARERRHRRAVHRARHGRRVRPCRPHDRAGARRDHRRAARRTRCAPTPRAQVYLGTSGVTGAIRRRAERASAASKAAADA